ncbi:unnamed protein product [Amoebophrya sp. A25]|nr:unnamed protein product [Amoebophrya sp. A25]|eukprot:GSA25T00020751001.1
MKYNRRHGKLHLQAKWETANDFIEGDLARMYHAETQRVKLLKLKNYFIRVIIQQCKCMNLFIRDHNTYSCSTTCKFFFLPVPADLHVILPLPLLQDVLSSSPQRD